MQSIASVRPILAPRVARQTRPAPSPSECAARGSRESVLRQRPRGGGSRQVGVYTKTAPGLLNRSRSGVARPRRVHSWPALLSRRPRLVRLPPRYDGGTMLPTSTWAQIPLGPCREQHSSLHSRSVEPAPEVALRHQTAASQGHQLWLMGGPSFGTLCAALYVLLESGLAVVGVVPKTGRPSHNV